MGFGNSKSDIPQYILSFSKSICKIDIPNKIPYGFLIKFFKNDKDFYCLLTDNDIITKEMIDKKEYIKFFYDGDSKIKKICLNADERYIKDFRDIDINSIVIEILPSDEIEKDYFLLPLINKYKDLKNEKIELIQYQKGVLTYSKGVIQEINNYEFTHSAKTDIDSQGIPIFLKNSNKVIGIQKSTKINNSNNYAGFIKPIFDFLKNFKEDETEEKNISNIKTSYKECKKEGEKIIYPNGSYYIGEEKDGKRQGKGKYYDENGNLKYDGDWVNDCLEGNGKYFYNNGT